jgi:glycosyltransferase involved in cell wall biosynthesis
LKILLSNKFYYPKGGDCVYSLELEKLLKKNGHEVAFFAMDNEKNLPSVFSKYFPSVIDYSSRNLSNIKEQVLRPVYSAEVRMKFASLLRDFRPDVVHVNNIHSQLSPVIVKEASEKGIPVVWTLHDYKLICSRYDSLRNERPCELCYTDRRNVIKHRCLKNSLAASLLAYAETMAWNRERIEKYTTRFICPSHFLKTKMMAAGFDEKKLSVFHNFIGEEKIAASPSEKGDYYCFIGRLSREKGIDTLCEAAIQIPDKKLYIVGTGPEENSLREKYKNTNIYFLGHQNWVAVQPILAKAKCIVLASKWYENNPLSIIESLANGTPVIGANIGGIPELIKDGVNGLLFQSGDVIDLKNKIEYFFRELQHKIDPAMLIEQAKIHFNAISYHSQLINLYKSISK